MGSRALHFDREDLADAVARIQRAVLHVEALEGSLPGDLAGLAALRQQAEEMRKGLIVLTALSDTLIRLDEILRAARPEEAREPPAAAP